MASNEPSRSGDKAGRGKGTPGDTSPGNAGMNSTKQLLDELDALMAKMLALPVAEGDNAPVEEELADLKEAARLPRVSATLTVIEPSAPEQEISLPPGESLSPEPRLDGPAPLAPPHAELRTEVRAPEPVMERTRTASPAAAKELLRKREKNNQPEPIPTDAIPPSLLKVDIPEVKVLPLAARSLSSLALLPLLWVNVLFDLCTHFLGPLGRWLRTASGRNFLGTLGVVLIVLAVGWLIRDWMSWMP